MQGEYLNFIVSRSDANLPRTPPRPLSPAAISQRRLASPDRLLAERDSHDLCLLACAGRPVNTHAIHPRQPELLLVLQGRLKSDRVWVVLRRAPVPRRAAVPTRWRIVRDDTFTPDDEFGVYEHTGRKISSGSHLRGTSCRPRA